MSMFSNLKCFCINTRIYNYNIDNNSQCPAMRVHAEPRLVHFRVKTSELKVKTWSDRYFTGIRHISRTEIEKDLRDVLRYTEI
jgi:hypothetical protein